MLHLVRHLPPELFECHQLRNLDLSNNKFEGSIPPEIGNLTLLETCSLSDNQLRGHIPVALGGCRKLKKLWLSRNKMIGKIPSQIGDLEDLCEIYLAGNDFYGVIPNEFCKCRRLRVIDFDDNSLSTLPPDLNKLERLERLFLQNNKFAGNLPDFGRYRHLLQFNASNNQFEGCIPASVAMCRKLRNFNIARCQLEGKWPRITLLQVPAYNAWVRSGFVPQVLLSNRIRFEWAGQNEDLKRKTLSSDTFSFPMYVVKREDVFDWEMFHPYEDMHEHLLQISQRDMKGIRHAPAALYCNNSGRFERKHSLHLQVTWHDFDRRMAGSEQFCIHQSQMGDRGAPRR